MDVRTEEQEVLAAPPGLGGAGGGAGSCFGKGGRGCLRELQWRAEARGRTSHLKSGVGNEQNPVSPGEKFLKRKRIRDYQGRKGQAA